MTDLRKAAEMALDAMLSEYSTGGENKYSPWDVIEALRQALAQPKQDDEAYGYAKYLAECIWEKHYKEESPHWRPFDNTLSVLTQIDNMTCGLEKAQPEQEPVAWLVSDAQGRYATIRDPAPYGEEVYEPLYAAPPKREWVGLTDEEKLISIWKDGSFHHGVEWAEAKLKEKNA